VASGEAHLAFLRRYLPYHFGAPCGRWQTRLMNRVNPALFSAASPPGCARPGRTARIRWRSTPSPPTPKSRKRSRIAGADYLLAVKATKPQHTSIKLRRKIAVSSPQYLSTALGALPR
jgi:hypothetical protein